jgi:hypothetical protein
MPYIESSDREELDILSKTISQHISSLPLEKQDGALNYAITKILKNVYPEKYFHYNRALGLLLSVQLEFYRRDVAAYEDKKITDNADVFKD